MIIIALSIQDSDVGKVIIALLFAAKKVHRVMVMIKSTGTHGLKSGPEIRKRWLYIRKIPEHTMIIEHSASMVVRRIINSAKPEDKK